MYKHIDVAFGGTNQRNNVIKVEELKNFVKEWGNKKKKFVDCFKTYFQYPEEFLKHFNATGSVSGYKGSCNSGFFPIDIDSKSLQDAFDKTKSLLIKLMREFNVDLRKLRIYFSGSKGFHIEIPAKLFGGFIPSPRLHEEFKALAKLISKDVDGSIYEKLRLWRIGNTINSKSGLYKIPLTLDEMFSLTIDEIKKIAQMPRRGISFDKSTSENIQLKSLYHQARIGNPVNKEGKKYNNLLNGIITQGDRNSCITSYAGRLRTLNIPKGEAETILKAVNHAHCSPPLDEKEITTIINSVYKYESNQFEIKTLSYDELVGSKEPDLEFLIQDLLPLGCLILLAGKPKLGKSLLALLIAISVGIGKDLWNKKVKQGGVLFISTEDGVNRLKKRVWVMLGDPKKYQADIHFFSGDMILTDKGVLEALRNKVLELQPRLIVLDPLINLFRGKELNSAEDMNTVLRPLQNLAKESGACVLVIHHARKSSGEDSIDVVQGSITISGVADGLLILRSFQGEEKRASLDVILKDAEIPKRVVLKLDHKLIWDVEGTFDQVSTEKLSKRILDLLADGDATTTKIAMTFNEPYETVRKSLRRLEVEGKIQSKQLGNGRSSGNIYCLSQKNVPIGKTNNPSGLDTKNAPIGTPLDLSQKRDSCPNKNLSLNLIDKRVLSGLFKNSSHNDWKNNNLNFNLVDEKTLKKIFQNLSLNSWKMFH